MQTITNESRQQALQLAEKYHYDPKHADLIESTSLVLFDMFQDFHQLGPKERDLLSHACILHDIGHFINENKHHRHTAYLIQNDQALEAYPSKERHLLSLIAFNHRKKLHKDMEKLSRMEKQMVLTLSSILRLADSLGYNGVSPQIVETHLSERTGTLFVKGLKNFVSAKERFNTKKELFEGVFQLEIHLQKYTKPIPKSKPTL